MGTDDAEVVAKARASHGLPAFNTGAAPQRHAPVSSTHAPHDPRVFRELHDLIQNPPKSSLVGFADAAGGSQLPIAFTSVGWQGACNPEAASPPLVSRGDTHSTASRVHSRGEGCGTVSQDTVHGFARGAA